MSESKVVSEVTRDINERGRGVFSEVRARGGGVVTEECEVRDQDGGRAVVVSCES